jgi:RNA polymerase sigma-70 factor (ECF subfamily)
MEVFALSCVIDSEGEKVVKNMDMQPSDEILVKKAQEGDKHSFDELYQKYKKRILNYIYRMVGNQMIAEELTQDTFIKAYTHLRDYRERHTFQAWLYKIAHNVVMNELRTRKPDVSLEQPLVVDDESIRLIDTVVDKTTAPDLVAKSHELREAIQKVLSSLSAEHRKVLVLCDIQGLSYEEASEILDISVGTVASRLSRAREQFNQKLRIEYDLGKDVV